MFPKKICGSDMHSALIFTFKKMLHRGLNGEFELSRVNKSAAIIDIDLIENWTKES